MESLQALHIVYKMAIIASIVFILMRVGIAELVDNLISRLPSKYKKMVEVIFWPGLSLLIIAAVLAGVVKFIMDMF